MKNVIYLLLTIISFGFISCDNTNDLSEYEAYKASQNKEYTIKFSLPYYNDSTTNYCKTHSNSKLKVKAIQYNDGKEHCPCEYKKYKIIKCDKIVMSKNYYTIYYKNNLEYQLKYQGNYTNKNTYIYSDSYVLDDVLLYDNIAIPRELYNKLKELEEAHKFYYNN